MWEGREKYDGTIRASSAIFILARRGRSNGREDGGEVGSRFRGRLFRPQMQLSLDLHPMFLSCQNMIPVTMGCSTLGPNSKKKVGRTNRDLHDI
jgi:hypothetical protein